MLVLTPVGARLSKVPLTANAARVRVVCIGQLPVAGMRMHEGNIFTWNSGISVKRGINVTVCSNWLRKRLRGGEAVSVLRPRIGCCTHGITSADKGLKLSVIILLRCYPQIESASILLK
jgi:hypothetical protein